MAPICLNKSMLKYLNIINIYLLLCYSCVSVIQGIWSVSSVVVPKRSTLHYSGELVCETILVHGLYPALSHGFKKSYEHYNDHILVDSIDQSVKLCEGKRKGFTKRNACPQLTCAKQPWVSY